MTTIAPLIGGYHFEQTSAASIWTITHNLNTLAPAVDCWITDGGNKEKVIPTTVTATSALVCTIDFGTPVVGEAFLT